MLILKCLVPVIILCFVRETIGKPAQNNISEGGGFGSIIWSWITYPYYYWWSAKEQQFATDDMIVSTINKLDNDIGTEYHNISIWCNDQTCTTMKCNSNGCKNNTCNIYDTDMNGQCREYHLEINSEDRTPLDSTEPLQKSTKKNSNNHNDVSPPDFQAINLVILKEKNKDTNDEDFDEKPGKNIKAVSQLCSNQVVDKERKSSTIHDNVSSTKIPESKPLMINVTQLDKNNNLLIAPFKQKEVDKAYETQKVNKTITTKVTPDKETKLQGNKESNSKGVVETTPVALVNENPKTNVITTLQPLYLSNMQSSSRDTKIL
ncbi:hypothetical protein ACJJTC_015337 [Scirpophaga incertulas]